MATTLDLSGNVATNAPNIDNTMCKANRNNAGSPVSSLTPQFVGEIVMDSTNRMLWRAIGLTNTQWEPTADNLQ